MTRCGVGSAGEPATRRLPVTWHMRPLQRQVPSRGFRRERGAQSFVATALPALAAVACSHLVTSPPGGNPPPERPGLAQTYRPTGHRAAGDGFVQLFEGKWRDSPADCETGLRPGG